MATSEDASKALAIMWMIVAVIFVLLILRVSMRVVFLASYGIDDSIYVAASICLLIYTILIQHSGYFGFGQTEAEIGNSARATRARLFECLGQNVSIFGMPLAKASLEAFVLRLVTVKWHQVAVWGAMILMSLASVGLSTALFTGYKTRE